MEWIDEISVLHPTRCTPEKFQKIKKVDSCVNPFFYKELAHVSRLGNLWSLVVKQAVAKLTGWVYLMSCTCFYYIIPCVFKKIWILSNKLLKDARLSGALLSSHRKYICHILLQYLQYREKTVALILRLLI